MALTEKQVDIIQSLYSVSSRLTRLNKNLLLLAKIDNAQFKEMQEIDFVELLNTSIPYFKDLAESNSIEMTIDINNPLTIHANKILSESLINNLIVNAIRHNIENGKISINLKGNTFTISNSGRVNRLIKKRYSGVSAGPQKRGEAMV